MYVAQVNPQIDTKIVKKRHFRMETSETGDKDTDLQIASSTKSYSLGRVTLLEEVVELQAEYHWRQIPKHLLYRQTL